MNKYEVLAYTLLASNFGVYINTFHGLKRVKLVSVLLMAYGMTILIFYGDKDEQS